MSWKTLAAVLAGMVVTGCGLGVEGTSDEKGTRHESPELWRAWSDPGLDSEGEPAPGPVAPPEPTPSATIRFTASDPETALVESTEFPLDETLQIYVVVDWSGLPVGTVGRLDIVNPRGLLYAEALVPIPEGGRTVYTLQVATTAIDWYQMTGTWTAAVGTDRNTLNDSAWTLY